jgi:hypothetical protein
MAPNSSVSAPRCLVPVLESVLPAGEHILACAVVATESSDLDLDHLPSVPPAAQSVLDALDQAGPTV